MLSIEFLYPVQYFLQSQVNKDWHFCSTGSISLRCASTSFSCFARKISTISFSSNPLFRPIEEIWHHRDQVGTWHVCIHRLWSQHFWWSQPLGYSDVTCSLPTQNKLWHQSYLNEMHGVICVSVFLRKFLRMETVNLRSGPIWAVLKDSL